MSCFLHIVSIIDNKRETLTIGLLIQLGHRDNANWGLSANIRKLH